MMRSILFTAVLAAPLFAAQSPYAISSWGDNQSTQLVHTRLPHGRVIGWLKLREDQSPASSGLVRFESLSLADFFHHRIADIFQTVKTECKPHTDTYWCHETLRRLSHAYKNEVHDRARIERLKRFQLAFFIGLRCTVLFGHDNDTSAFFPSVRLIEHFSDLHAFNQCTLVLTADEVPEEASQVTRIHHFPGYTDSPFSMWWFDLGILPQDVVDTIVPEKLHYQ